MHEHLSTCQCLPCLAIAGVEGAAQQFVRDIKFYSKEVQTEVLSKVPDGTVLYTLDGTGIGIG